VPLPHPEPLAQLKHALISGDEWIWLLEITSPTGGALLDPADGSEVVPRITPHTVPLAYGSLTTGEPKTWSPWPCRIGELAQDSKGNINGLQISIGNALASVSRLLKANDWLRNHRVRVLLTHVSLLDQAEAHTEWRATVVETTHSWGTTTLTLAAFAFMDFTVPQQLVTPLCPFKYRGKGCAFAGDPGDVDLGACVKHLEACEARGQWEQDHALPKMHPRNFGGFPGIAKGPVPVPQA